MTNMIKTAVVGAVAAAFVASVAIAQQGTGEPQRRGPGFGQDRMGAPGGPGGRGFGPGLMALDLTQEQRDKIRAIHEAQRDANDGPPADAKLRQQLELELLADAPNDVTIENLKQQLAAAQLEQLSRHIAVQKQISQILTAEQRAKARERLAEGRGPGRRGRGFGPRH